MSYKQAAKNLAAELLEDKETLLLKILLLTQMLKDIMPEGDHELIDEIVCSQKEQILFIYEEYKRFRKEV